ncbi:MAG: hypothetical protein ABW039_00200, partial [Sphingobium sp.]
MTNQYLSADDFASLNDITSRHARRVLDGFASQRMWKGFVGRVRLAKGRGGNSGLRYEVLLNSLPESLQRSLRCDF